MRDMASDSNTCHSYDAAFDAFEVRPAFDGLDFFLDATRFTGFSSWRLSASFVESKLGVLVVKFGGIFGVRVLVKVDVNILATS
jgi:hypothetical protein